MLNSLEILRLDRLNHRQLMESTVHCSRYTVSKGETSHMALG